MKSYREYTASERQTELAALMEKYAEEQVKGYKLNMARGVPAPEQLELSMEMLNMPPEMLTHSAKGVDVRNYGELTGIDEAKTLFASLLGVEEENLIIGGQASLEMMYNCVMRAWVFGVYGGSKPWGQQGKVKFLCPTPGYDRHFRITEAFGFELISIPMTPEGPDMELIRQYVENDASVKGVWCVPKYSNPQGYTYSERTVEAFAALKPAADDFRIFWDNAYMVHGFREEEDELANIFDFCRKYGSEDMVYEFCSTSKITFPGAGVAALASGKNSIALLTKQMGVQTIGCDKLNQLRHVLFLKDAEGVRALMKKQAAILAPKFDMVIHMLHAELDGLDIGTWTEPNGGYFVCFTGMKNTAKRAVQLCEGAGVRLTGAGAPFPYGIDPEDNMIRIAPTCPTLEQLSDCIRLFCLAERIAALEAME